MAQTAVLIFVRYHVPQALDLDFGVNGHNMIMLIVQVLVFLQQEQTHELVLTPPICSHTAVFFGLSSSFREGFLSFLICFGQSCFLEKQVFQRDFGHLDVFLTRLRP